MYSGPPYNSAIRYRMHCDIDFCICSDIKILRANVNFFLLYTVGHKKRATFIFTITLANVDRFQ